MMPRALGTLIILGKEEELTRYHYYLPLPDVLLDLVETNPNGEDAERLAGLAHSLTHDVLNLAVLAGRLLWYEALTPDTTRSPDLVSIATDAESYFLHLKASCDLLAEIAVLTGCDRGRRGQAPSGSLNELSQWVRNNPERIDPNFHFLGEELPWFDQIHGIRTNLAHRGYDMLIYTNRIRLSFLAAPFGRGAFRRLQQARGQKVEPVLHRLTPLLPTIQNLMRSLLHFSERLADAIVRRNNLREPSHTHALNGVYVPALHHLDSYELPVNSELLGIAATCLQNSCGDYRAAAKMGYPNGYWWRFLVQLCEYFGRSPTYVGRFTEGPTGVLVDWRIIFSTEGSMHGIIARDAVLKEEKWLAKTREAFHHFLAEDGLATAVLVAHESVAVPESGARAELTIPHVVDTDPVRAAECAFDLLTK